MLYDLIYRRFYNELCTVLCVSTATIMRELEKYDEETIKFRFVLFYRALKI